MREEEIIDTTTYELALAEPLPEELFSFPSHAPHLLSHVQSVYGKGVKTTTTIQTHLQQQVNSVLLRHQDRLAGNHVYNAAAIVAEVNSGNVVAYVGNLPSGKMNHEEVDIITKPRSSGSILKPLLFAAMLEDGRMLPSTLIPDIPTEMGGFSPENFSREFDGSVHAHEALIRSLNVPAVFELKDYRYERFYNLLQSYGITSLQGGPGHYGLTLILGGAETTLWDVAGMYASMARVLNHYFERPGKERYSATDIHPLTFVSLPKDSTQWVASSTISAASIYSTFNVMKELHRPGEETGWRYFNSTKPIAWKTGTSLGHRDAWTVGVTPEYVVGVWVGNADGEGRHGLTGTEAAAPIMFDIFSLLPGHSWFSTPSSEMVEIPICFNSGMRASSQCEKIDTVKIPLPGLKTLSCPYHQEINLSSDFKYRVNSTCYHPMTMKTKKWFVLPPVQEYYYKRQHSDYASLPPFKPDCAGSTGSSMEVVYPKENAKLLLPRELNGTLGKMIVEVSHRHQAATIYWHLDGQYLGFTKSIHQRTFSPETGNHKLTLVDQDGEVLERAFEVKGEKD